MAGKIQEATRPVPAQFGGDVTAWATWLYYAEGKTQADVASALGVSRASVSNYLADARRAGLVNISVAPDLLENVAISQRLADRYDLAGAYVSPVIADPNEPNQLRQRLGIAGAQVLQPWLSRDTVLGVAWGRTIADVARALPEKDLPDVKVVQISGSSLGDEATTPESCTLLIASRLNAKCLNYHAPAVVTSQELRDALMREPILEKHFERIRGCNIVLLGVGELNEQTRWAYGDDLLEQHAAAYQAKGAIGVMIGRFIDAAGKEVEGPLTGRQIGIELGQLMHVPVRLCVAGGAEKYQAIRAMLAGGYATHLVTDIAMATRLLEGKP